MKEIVKKLFLMQLRYGGISEEEYHFLPVSERTLLSQRQNGRFYLSPESRKHIRVVLCGGVFDIIHIGHVFTLIEAKKQGDILVVAIADDKHIQKKGRDPIHSSEYRKILVENIKPVDIAITGFENPQTMVEFVGPDVIVYGYDQKEFLKPPGIEIIKLANKIDESKFKTGKILDSLGV